MNKKGELPKFYKLVQVGAAIGAVAVSIAGLSIIISSFKVLGLMGVTAFAMTFGTGIIYITGGLIFYGLISCFLYNVKVQIESRIE
jgi:hypothetical protein